MKHKLFFGILFLVFGAFISLGPQTIFPVCGLHSNISASKMACFWTGQAEIGIGSLIAIVGILLLVLRNGDIQIGLCISLIPTGIIAILIPNTLIGVCNNENMGCRALTLPALALLGSFTIIASLISIIYLTLKSKGKISLEKRKAADNKPINDI